VQGLFAIVVEGDDGEQGLRFTFVSERAEALLGYPVELWLTAPEFWMSRLHPDDRDTLVALYRDIIGDDGHAQVTVDTDWGLQYRMQAADGREIWFQDAVRHVAGKDGMFRLRDVMVDMSTRKKMEVRLEYLLRIMMRSPTCRIEACCSIGSSRPSSTVFATGVRRRCCFSISTASRSSMTASATARVTRCSGTWSRGWRVVSVPGTWSPAGQ